jgi:hypothetical protein
MDGARVQIQADRDVVVNGRDALERTQTLSASLLGRDGVTKSGQEPSARMLYTETAATINSKTQKATLRFSLSTFAASVTDHDRDHHVHADHSSQHKPNRPEPALILKQ